MGLITVNGSDLATFGFTVRSVDGLAGGVSRSYATAPAPHGVGLTLLDDSPRYSARNITIRGTLIADTPAELVTAYRRLVAWMSVEPIDVAWSLESDRFARGRLLGDPVTVADPQGLSRIMPVQFVVECHSPYLAATETTTVTLSTTPAACALGTWDSAPVITVTGASTVTITYADHEGTTQASMTFAGVTSPLVVSLATYTATHAGGLNAMDLLTSGDFFLLRAIDSDADTDAWPTLTLSAGTGTATYLKRWR
ncbi:MAG: hypothetical protein ACYC1Z_13460 [Georgenia sp.]